MAEISAIIPVYNVEKYLPKCIDSILAQSLKDIEIILIDDGSEDNCPEIIDKYAKLDARIKAIHKKNEGYGKSCNLGLKIAQGNYISIIEPDDYIDFKMYEDLYNIAQEFDCDIVKSPFFENLQTKIIKQIKSPGWDNDKIPQNKSFNIYDYPLFLSYHPSIWSAIYKKEFLDCNNIKFMENENGVWSDNLFQVQTMCLAKKINYTPKPYYYWLRTDIDKSKKLKDWQIPYIRTDEIHNWLNQNNINDFCVLSALYIRELSYIKLVFRKKIKIKELKNLFDKTNKMISKMDVETIKNSETINKNNKKYFFRIKNNVKKVYFWSKFCYPVKYLLDFWRDI